MTITVQSQPIKPPPIVVTDDDADVWERARGRARGFGNHLQLVSDRRFDDGPRIIHFLSRSKTDLTRQYRTELTILPAGQLQTRCSCDSGAHGRVCWHVAAGIDRADLWPAVFGPPATPTPIGQPACPYCGLTTGLHVTVRETNPGGYQRFWKCLECHAHLGYEDQLPTAFRERLEAVA